MNRYNIWKRYLVIFACVFIFAQTNALADQLSSSIEQYRAKVESLLVTTQDSAVKEYLQNCLIASENIKGMDAESPNLTIALKAFGVGRDKAFQQLNITPEALDDPAVKQEDEACKNIYIYTHDDYLELINLQTQLFERKYFKTETAKNSNFIEGFINGHFGLTRAETGDVTTELSAPSLGVSPWEAIFRLEPTFVFDGVGQAAVLGTLGLSYTFFPDIDRSRTPVSFHESLWSEYLQKSGIRIGLGAGQINNKSKSLLGAGIQVNIIGLWAIWELDDGNCVFGASTSDLSIFKTFLPWF